MGPPRHTSLACRTPAGPFVCLLALGLLVRVGILVLERDALSTDPDGYRALAENLVQHGTFGSQSVPTAYRPPLYPWTLAACVLSGPWSRTAIALLHVGLGLGTVWITCRLGQRWGLGRGAWVAGALVACDPILLAQSAQVMTETLAALLAAAALLCLTRTAQSASLRDALLAGACGGLAVLCRPTFLPWGLLAGLMIVGWAVPTGAVGPALPTGAPTGRAHIAGRAVDFAAARRWWAKPTLLVFFLGGLVVALAPWAVRNHRQFGRPIVTTTHGGYTLLRANNPYFYEHLRRAPWGTAWDSAELDREWLAKAPQGTPADELRADRLAYAEALQNIRNEPGAFALACLARVGRLFGMVPYQTTPAEGTLRRAARYGVGVWYLFEMPLALVGFIVVIGGALRRRAGRAEGPNADLGWYSALLLVGCFTAAHALYWTDMRMRAPLVPAMALAAVAGGAWVLAQVARRKS